jgi:hypothetical protein
MKLRLAAIISVAAAILFGLSFFVIQPQINSLLIGLAGNLFAVAVGIVIINQYMESRERKEAVMGLFILSGQAISTFHNEWLKQCWAKFGRERYGDIGTEYTNAKGDPTALTQDVRQQIYEIYVQDAETQSNVRKLDEALAELSRLAGWSLDPRILSECIRARIAISRLVATSLDGSPEAATAVAEHILDIVNNANGVRDLLMHIAGIPDADD